MSHGPDTVLDMFPGYYFLAGIVTHLPMLAVLIPGIVLVARQRARIGARSATFAQLGLGLLILDLIAQAAWTMAIPQLYRATDFSVASFGIINSTISLMLSLLLAAGVAMLIAAVLTRTTQGGGFNPGPFYGAPEFAAQGHPAAPYSSSPPTAPYAQAQPTAPYAPQAQPTAPQAQPTAPQAQPTAPQAQPTGPYSPVQPAESRPDNPAAGREDSG